MLWLHRSEAEAVPSEEVPPAEPEQPAEEEVDIDLNDPEVAAAATKIQAGFRGHMTRKEIKEKKVSFYVWHLHSKT